jgi:DDE domain
MLSAKRDVSAAKRFFKKIMRADHRRLPYTIGVDKHASYPEAFATSVKEKILPFDCKLRRAKYLNNVIEQDHRGRRTARPDPNDTLAPASVVGEESMRRVVLRNFSFTGLDAPSLQTVARPPQAERISAMISSHVGAPKKSLTRNNSERVANSEFSLTWFLTVRVATGFQHNSIIEDSAIKPAIQETGDGVFGRFHYRLTHYVERRVAVQFELLNRYLSAH